MKWVVFCCLFTHSSSGRSARSSSGVPRGPLEHQELAVTAWQILCWSVLLAVGLTGLLMFKPGPHTGTGGLAASFHMLVTGDLAHLELARWCTFFVLLSVVVLGRTSLSVTRSVLRSRRERTEHLRQLSFLASHDATRDALLLENPTAIAYCLPGPRPAVVLTTGALAALDGGTNSR